jgi:hypothetical protein
LPLKILLKEAQFLGVKNIFLKFGNIETLIRDQVSDFKQFRKKWTIGYWSQGRKK